MNFRQIEAFRAVMICGTASRAAEMLRISQPAVSRHIAELEASARLTLFERSRGRLKVTAEGKAFFEEVTRAFTGIERLRFAAENIRSFVGARLRVVSMPALGHAFLPRVVGRFARQFPNSSVLLQVRSSEFVREEIAAGNYDLGFAADEINSAGVEVQPFASPDAVCLLPQGHRLAGYQTVRPVDFDNERFVTLANEDAARSRFDRIFAEAGVRPKIVSETQYSLTVCNLVRNGVGIALVNPFSLDGLDLTGMALVRFRPSAQFRSLLVRPPNAPQSRLADAFLGMAELERDRQAAGWL
ncbi:LysR substrate-binding domain-containing protein [Neoaquamicrobium sediminum]|uniref:LysR substrate-binding domain-containing protein n=1 Tax=Neoaquamicrobium sediminum TaxID=1849104 RepID=A0ABV3WZI9_9HYPH|nr:LysR substrate-binding domain-containing protein [Mesorhizobium sediminum]NRC56501.1 LysR family transcriptional regulator [Mesorhizobium sediminum]